MSDPRVTFVVPCFKLAHLLGECVESILAQSYGDFEVLIMDDCSPDDTPAVAAALAAEDARVKHVRNDPNLGHLRNYNKGIGLAKGEYIWLISADDKLRTPSALERYVRVMDANPRAGYATSPGTKLCDGREGGTEGDFGPQDAVFPGPEFAKRIARYNTICTATGMVRRSCYREVGDFPLDLPFAGDWYLWCAFALSFDVAYFAESMANYRFHELNMTKLLTTSAPSIMIRDDFEVRWRIRRAAAAKELGDVVATFDDALASDYAGRIWDKLNKGSVLGLTPEGFEESLTASSPSEALAGRFRARVYSTVADRFYAGGDLLQARRFYGSALRDAPGRADLRLKRALLRLGRWGMPVREGISTIRRAARWSNS